MKLTKQYYIIFLIMVTEVLGFSLILPFLPFFAQDLGASPLMIGLIFATFSFFQFFSAPIMGKLSDHYGRKPLLILSQLSTFLGFVILAFANSLWMIALSRIVDGMFGSNFTISQAYLSDISTKKDRSKIFGLSGAAFGFGFLIGPGIGGYLAQFSYSLPSFLAAGISLITIALTLFFLPETIKRTKGRMKFDVLQLNQFSKYFKMPRVSERLFSFFTYLFAHSIFVSMLALFAERQLDLNAADVGILLTYIGIISIILRGFLLSKLIDWFGERKLELFGIVSIIIGLIASAFITEFWMFFVTITLFAFGSGVSRPVLVGEISRSVSQKEQGSIMGVTNSLGSITQIVGPLVGGFILSYFFPGAIMLVSAGVMLLGLMLVLKIRN